MAVSSLQGPVLMSVCNPLDQLSHPFPAECTNNALKGDGPHASLSTEAVDMSDINGSH